MGQLYAFGRNSGNRTGMWWRGQRHPPPNARGPHHHHPACRHPDGHGRYQCLLHRGGYGHSGPHVPVEEGRHGRCHWRNGRHLHHRHPYSERCWHLHRHRHQFSGKHHQQSCGAERPACGHCPQHRCATHPEHHRVGRRQRNAQRERQHCRWRHP